MALSRYMYTLCRALQSFIHPIARCPGEHKNACGLLDVTICVKSDGQLKTKVDPRTVRVNIFLMAVDSKHRYWNELERANEDIYEKTPFGCNVFYK